MSWSDDTRCLHCDGRLPLYRKITHGQFCSSAHRKAYWTDQERLAVERLHQTHNSLRASRLAEPPESILGSPLTALQVPPTQPGDPSFGTLMPQAWTPQVVDFPSLVAADPLEYEMMVHPSHPSLTPHRVEVRPLPLAKLIRLWADFSGCRWTGEVVRWVAAPIAYDVDPHRPSLTWLSGEVLARGGQVSLPFSLVKGAGQVLWTAEPVASSLLPLTRVNRDVPGPQTEVLLQLLDEQAPRPDRLFPLAYLTPAEGGGWQLRRIGNLEPIDPEPLVSQGETNLQYTFTFVPSHAAMVGLPVGCAGVANNIRAVEPQTIDLRLDGPSTQVALATTPRDLNLRFGSTQLSFPNSCEARATIAELTPAKFSDPAIAIPERTVSAPPLRGVRDQFTSLAALPYGQNEPLCIAAAGPLPQGYPFPQPPATDPLIPQSRLEPLDAKPVSDFMPTVEGTVAPPVALVKHPPIWSHAVDFWQHAPRDLKLLLFAIPALIALAFHPSLPKVSLAAPTTASDAPSNFRRVLDDQWSSVRKSVLDRAAIALDEDFRGGLDDWASPAESTTDWSFDQTGFVRPGPLAIYRPSVGLTDYQMQFLGLIDKKALSWVVRAADFDNYYVIKMTVLKPGPVPTLGITRYAVINGKAQNRADTPVPISARPDMLYRVLVDIHEDTFSLIVQGQMVDTWSEPRLAHGGVGFFSASGEESRVRWVQVTHQYDMLGRLCAYLAPYNIPQATGSWQP